MLHSYLFYFLQRIQDQPQDYVFTDDTTAFAFEIKKVCSKNKSYEI